MANEPLKIIQLSDSHLYADPKKALLSVNTHESFQAVIDLVKAEHPQIDLILHSGDISQDGSEASYLYIANVLKTFNVPVYCIPGNHDNAKAMNYLYPRETMSNQRHLILKNWHIILLDSQKPGAVEGYLDQPQLDFMQECLQAYPEHHAIIVFHHQPVSVSSRWLDNLGLKNADEFWRVISHYPKVHTVLFGHIHQEYETMMKHIRCYATPATCFQFKYKSDHFALEDLPQGYRWIYLYDDGHLETGVKRLANYVGVFDKHATGY